MMKKEFLSVEEVCTYLGISPSAVYKLSHYKTLPKYCPNGKKIYFRRDDIDLWLKKHRVSSLDELLNNN